MDKSLQLSWDEDGKFWKDTVPVETAPLQSFRSPATGKVTARKHGARHTFDWILNWDGVPLADFLDFARRSVVILQQGRYRSVTTAPQERRDMLVEGYEVNVAGLIPRRASHKSPEPQLIAEISKLPKNNREAILAALNMKEFKDPESDLKTGQLLDEYLQLSWDEDGESWETTVPVEAATLCSFQSLATGTVTARGQRQGTGQTFHWILNWDGVPLTDFLDLASRAVVIWQQDRYRRAALKERRHMLLEGYEVDVAGLLDSRPPRRTADVIREDQTAILAALGEEDLEDFGEEIKTTFKDEFEKIIEQLTPEQIREVLRFVLRLGGPTR